MTSTTPVAKPVAAPVAAPERLSIAARRNRASNRSARRRLQLRDAARLDYQITLEEDESLREVASAEWLGSSSDRLSRGDLVVVLCLTPGREFWHQRMVVSTDPLLQVTRTVEILHVDLAQRVAAMAAPDLSKVVVEQVGDTWRLRQGERVIAAGFTAKAAADKALDELKNGQKASSPAPV